MHCILSLSLALLLLCSIALGEERIKDIPYYDKDVVGSGDLEYRADRCKLDVCIPDHRPGERLPTIVWFHGGGLSGGEKSIIQEFTKHRVIVVAADYRLMPKAKAPDFIEDAAAAVAWTFANIEKHHGEKGKIYVGGHSAGGYLTMMLAMDAQYLSRHHLRNTELAGIFAVSGQATTHFAIVAAANAARGKPKPEKFTRDNPITINEFAPLAYTDQPLPPIHLLCGDPKLEWPARVEENALLAAMIRTAKNHNVIEYRSFAGTDHGSCFAPSIAYICEVLGKK